MKVLILEADTEFRTHLIQRLSALGFDVVGCGNPEEAVGMAIKERADAVVLGLSGFRGAALAFLADVREKCPEPPIILINRAGDMTLSIEAMKLGAVDEVTAPVHVEDLAGKLRDVAKG